MGFGIQALLGTKSPTEVVQEKKVSESQIAALFNKIFDANKLTPLFTVFVLNFLALAVFGHLRGPILFSSALLATVVEKQSYSQLGLWNSLKLGLGAASLFGLFKAATAPSSATTSKPQVVLLQQKSEKEKEETEAESTKKMEAVFEQVTQTNTAQAITSAEIKDTSNSNAVHSLPVDSMPLSPQEKKAFEAVWIQATETDKLEADFKKAWKEAKEFTEEESLAFLDKLWNELTPTQQKQLEKLDEKACLDSVKPVHRKDFLQWLKISPKQFAAIFKLPAPTSAPKNCESQALARITTIAGHLTARL